MKSTFRISLVIALFAFASGCAYPRYDQPSPGIQTVRNSGYTANTARDQRPARYNPYTTLEGAVKQAGEVQITVTFQYSPPSRGRQARAGRCKLHIKSSDSALADVKRCRIEQAGNTFMVSLRTSQGKKSFDLRALGGRYANFSGPLFYSNSIISIGVDTMKKRTVVYTYVGRDPFNGSLR